MAARWFVEIDGKSAGPYPLEQILGLFHEGKVSPGIRVAAETSPDRWVSVQELALRHSTPNRPFSPPPRPSDDMLTPHQNGPSTLPLTSRDDAIGLFEALQAAREKKAAKIAPPPAEIVEEIEPSGFRLTKPMIYAAAASLLLVVAVWGAQKLFTPASNPVSASTQPASTPFQTSPASAPAAARPAATVSRPAPPPPAARPMAPSRVVSRPAEMEAAERAREERERAERERERELAEKERDRDLNPPAEPVTPGVDWRPNPTADAAQDPAQSGDPNQPGGMISQMARERASDPNAEAPADLNPVDPNDAANINNAPPTD